ncbi:hypothetical protein FI667_g5546, partial [Globisporangium splendens]
MKVESGTENSTRLTWRNTPDLLLNEESLVDVITKLRAQVQAIEKNELLSGTALPPWLLKALTEIAGSVDSVVECQALQDQVDFLQKEMLELRHEILLQQSTTAGNTGGGTGYSPIPRHRLSTGGLRSHGSHRNSVSVRPVGLGSILGGSSQDVSTDIVTATAVAFAQAESHIPNIDHLLKPLWDCIHKQTNDFAALRDSFKDAKDTVTRLQSEIKRRDAVIQARNSKHENVIQSQVDKLNESLRACVTRNDLIGAEQRIAQQMKADRQRTLEEVETRSNQILDDLLSSRAEQEDINSMNGEAIQLLTRKQGRAEELIAELTKQQHDAKEKANEMQRGLEDTIRKLFANTNAVCVVEEKMEGFEDTQKFVQRMSVEVKASFAVQDQLRGELEKKTIDRIAESVAIVRSELEAANNTVMGVVNQNLDSEIKAIAGKLDMVTLTVAESGKKIAVLQKQNTTTEEQMRSQFTQVFDSVDRILQSMSNLSEESMKLSYNLQHVMQSGETLTKEVRDYCESADRRIAALQKHTHALQTDLDKTNRTVENELAVVKNQLFHAEDAISTLKRDIEETQGEVDRNFRTQYQENKDIKSFLDALHTAKEEMQARQDSAESQMLALQAGNRAEIQAATMKLVSIVDKESDRIEALYTSFQSKQEHFGEVVAKSSIRNMDLADMNREIDKICESFVQECWKFETSARSSNKTSARPSDNNSSPNDGRKLFNERQQQLLVHNCQFIADLIVARAEYEALQTGCNKELKNQHDIDETMLDVQVSIVDKVWAKIHTKIMNNKDIGEQFDKSTLDRRELYIGTISNMLTASIKRRTLGGVGCDQRGGRDESGGASHFETQRLLNVSTTGNGTSRRKTSRETNNRRSTALVASGLPADAESTRAAFSPGSSYVFRAGFRLPKATPPNSPLSAFRNGAINPLGNMSPVPIGEDSDSGDCLTSPPEIDCLSNEAGAASGKALGWAPEDSKDQDTGVSKSCSLPVLKQ